MKLGIGSYAYYWATGAPGHTPDSPLTVHDLIEKAAALGVRLVQIDDNLPLHRLPAPDLAAVVRDARASAIELEIGTRGIQPESLRQYVALASSIGASLVRTVIDVAGQRLAPDDIVATLRTIVPDLESAAITLAIENHDGFSARTLAHIIERIDSDHVGVCLDTVNSFGALEGPGVVVETLGPQCVNLHAKDFRIRRADHLMGFVLEGTPAGQGMLDIPRLLETLARYRRAPNVILELWPPPEADLSATIAKEDAWVRESIAYLRRYIQE